MFISCDKLINLKVIEKTIQMFILFSVVEYAKHIYLTQ